MSGLHLPPAEPPADDVAYLLDLAREARAERDEAALTLARLQLAAADASTEGLSAAAAWRLRMRYDVELALAADRLQAWARCLDEAAAFARRYGLHL